MSAYQATFGNSIQDYFTGRIRKVCTQRQERFVTLKTREDAEAYVSEVQEKILKIFALPQEKSALNAVITGTVEGEGYRVEKVIYHSRPSFPVTANLYVPAKLDKPAPAVLFLCGHSQDGKAGAVYHTACQVLARQGYVVLVVDPISQGERYQFLNTPNSGTFSGQSCCSEHNMVGKQLQLVGEYFGSWRAWDAIRGLDYLRERAEVDKARIGITGNSGGGTMTTFVNALEDRFIMAAPSCYITSWRRNIENELPADIEQMPPGITGLGLEMGDLLIARAPRPLIILAQKNDFFDARGSEETYRDVKRIYELLGAEDKVKLFVGPTNHGYSRHNREAMYEFFNIQSGLGGKYIEPEEMTLLEGKQLLCVPVGQVEYLAGRKMVRDFVQEKADKLAAARTEKSPEELRQLLKAKLQLGNQNVPYYRILRGQVQEAGLPRQKVFSRFALEVNSKIPTVMRLMANESYFHLPEGKKAVLYIPHLDTMGELMTMNFNADQKVFGLDVQGIGDTLPAGCDQGSKDFFVPYRSDYHFASLYLIFGETYLGAKVREILGALALLESKGYDEIHLAGRGQGAIPAALAALIYGKTSKVTLLNAPKSWDAMLRDPVTLWPQSAMLPGILKDTDLPEIYGAIADCKIMHEWDNMFKSHSDRFETE